MKRKYGDYQQGQQENYGGGAAPVYGQNIDPNYGRHISPEQLFNVDVNNPYSLMARPYVRNIFTGRSQHPAANFGAAQIVGGRGLPNSMVYPSRSENKKYGYTLDHNNDPYAVFNAGVSRFDSERTGLVPLLNEYITERRQNANNPLSYNPYAKHSAFNVRRPSSPSPSEYWNLTGEDRNRYKPSENYAANRLPDKDELYALNNLSGQNPRFGFGNKKTYAEVVKQWLNNEGSRINMLSERPACDRPDNFGCKQFLPTIMPRGSNYGYNSTSSEGDLNRNALFDTYNKNSLQTQQLAQPIQNQRISFNTAPQVIQPAPPQQQLPPQQQFPPEQLTLALNPRSIERPGPSDKERTNTHVKFSRGGHVAYDKDFMALVHKIQRYLDSVRN